MTRFVTVLHTVEMAEPEGGQVVIRRVVAALLSLILMASCDGTEKPNASSTPSPKKDTPEPFEAIAEVEPPHFKPLLTAKNIQRCLYKEQLDIDSVAGLYFGPNDLIEGEVENSRELEFDAPTAELLEPKAFAKVLTGLDVDIEEDDVVTTKALAWALGVTPRGRNVNAFTRGEGSGLIAGFYSPRSGRIVIEQRGKLDSEYITMAHEFVHAATDQAFGIPRKKVEPIVDDLSLATASVVEGDASLTELRVSSRLAPSKAVKKGVRAFIEYKKTFKKDRDKGVPYLLIDMALFPYQWGPAFTCAIYKERGWPAINRMYDHPPTSSAQVLFPKRFLERERPMKTLPLKKPGQLWQLRDQGQLGAAHLKALFEAPGDQESNELTWPLGRAASWGGGSYKVWTVGSAKSEYVVGLSLAEHKEFDGLLCSSMSTWYRAAFEEAKRVLVADRTTEMAGIDQDAILSCRRNKVTMAFGPDIEFLRRVIGLEK